MFAEPLGPFDAVANNWVNGHKADVLNAANLDELQAVHYSFAELLKHFLAHYSVYRQYLLKFNRKMR